MSSLGHTSGTARDRKCGFRIIIAKMITLITWQRMLREASARKYVIKLKIWNPQVTPGDNSATRIILSISCPETSSQRYSSNVYLKSNYGPKLKENRPRTSPLSCSAISVPCGVHWRFLYHVSGNGCL